MFTIIGVLSPKMQEGGEDNDRNRQIYIPFSTMSDLTDTKYLGGIWLTTRATTSWPSKAVRETHGERRITFGPSDHNAIYVANLMTELHQFSILSLALQVLLSLVGALTLGDCGHRVDEYHAGRGAAADPRDWHREGAGREAEGIFSLQFHVRSDGDHEGRRDVSGIALAVSRFGAGGRIPFYSALAKTCGGGRYPTADFADVDGGGDGDSVMTGLVSGMIPAIARRSNRSRRCDNEQPHPRY